jgi:hypothetical protein
MEERWVACMRSVGKRTSPKDDAGIQVLTPTDRAFENEMGAQYSVPAKSGHLGSFSMI